MKLLKSKKGNVLDQLGALGVGLASLVIIFAVVFLIIANVKANADVVADGNATAAVNTIQGAAADVPGWIPLIIITVIGALLISLVAFFKR